MNSDLLNSYLRPKYFLENLSILFLHCFLSYSTNNMIIFRLLKDSLEFFGIRSPQSFQQFHRFTLKNLMVFMYFLTSTTLMGLFFIYEDGTLAEYSSAIFGFLSSAATLVIISTLIWKTGNLYKLIGHFEDIVRKREYQRKILNWWFNVSIC